MLKSLKEWRNIKEEFGPGEGNTTNHFRYRCPHCNGINAYTGILGEEVRYRGSAKCNDCGEGFAAVARKDLRLWPKLDS